MGRIIIFWAHLVAGLAAGLVVLGMAATGVLLTYEAQIVDWAKARAVRVSDAGVPLAPDDLVAALVAQGAQPGQKLELDRDPTQPAEWTQGRQHEVVDPYTGAVVPGAGSEVAAFFGQVEGLHRWLSPGAPSDVGRAVVDTANVAFLFLVVTGLYLWIPPIWRWSRLKTQMLLHRGLPNAQARDYNWHHVFGIWALIPLFLIVLSGVVISYPWASRMVYWSVGEEAPQGRGRPLSQVSLPARFEGASLTGAAVRYDALIETATSAQPDWRTATLTLPQDKARYVAIALDAGNGVQASKQTQVILDRGTGEVVLDREAEPRTTGAKLRRWFRFVHTGEVYGVVGQTIAGLASIAAAVLAYTGMALGVRRLIRMARRRRGTA